jgi:hypothetical protein
MVQVECVIPTWFCLPKVPNWTLLPRSGFYPEKHFQNLDFMMVFARPNYPVHVTGEKREFTTVPASSDHRVSNNTKPAQLQPDTATVMVGNVL